MSTRGALTGKVALITGGASGIGRAIAHEFCARGGEVVLADRQLALAEEVSRGLIAKGWRATAAELDVRDGAAFLDVARATRRRSGAIDYLFNNAGIGIGGEAANFTLADWDDVTDVNVRGVTNGIQAVYPWMVARRSGHIVNTASVAGLMPTPGEVSYVASKHAVVGLSKSLRIEAKRYGVKVSALCPGVIRTAILTGGRYGRTNLNLSDADALRVWEKLRPIEPATLAREGLDAVLRDEAIIVLPRWWKALWLLDRVAPKASRAFWGVVLDRTRRDLTPLGATFEPNPPEGD
jgi:NAD(P)-dependent dehydrogenase (short-subunit alcohol dehydrogenase family)